jgi:hypothetical protein
MTAVPLRTCSLYAFPRERMKGTVVILSPRYSHSLPICSYLTPTQAPSCPTTARQHSTASILSQHIETVSRRALCE